MPARTLPIYGEMVERLRIEKELCDSQYPTCQHLFHRNGEPIKNFRKAWDAACTAANLEGLMFHDLRRTAVRNIVRAGIPEKTAMAISGHKTRAVFDRYNIVKRPGSDRRDRADGCASEKFGHTFGHTGAGTTKERG